METIFYIYFKFVQLSFPDTLQKNTEWSIVRMLFQKSSSFLYFVFAAIFVFMLKTYDFQKISHFRPENKIEF